MGCQSYRLQLKLVVLCAIHMQCEILGSGFRIKALLLQICHSREAVSYEPMNSVPCTVRCEHQSSLRCGAAPSLLTQSVATFYTGDHGGDFVLSFVLIPFMSCFLRWTMKSKGMSIFN